MPTINDMAAHYASDTSLVILPIDLDRNLSADLAYFNQKHYRLKCFKPVGIVPQQLFHGVLPTTALIDKHGAIVFLRMEEGAYNTSDFYSKLDSLLRK